MSNICTDCCVRNAEIEFLKSKLLFYEKLVEKMNRDKQQENEIKILTLENSIRRNKKLDVDGSGELL